MEENEKAKEVKRKTEEGADKSTESKRRKKRRRMRKDKRWRKGGRREKRMEADEGRLRHLLFLKLEGEAGFVLLRGTKC